MPFCAVSQEAVEAVNDTTLFIQPDSSDKSKSTQEAQNYMIQPGLSTKDSVGIKVNPATTQWGYASENLDIHFTQNELTIEEGEIVSNALRIVNKRKEKIVFTVDLSAPKRWKQLTNTDKWFELNPQDSIFIPIFLIPGNMLGNTNYLISAFLITENQEQLANVFFMAGKKVFSKWEVSTIPSKTIYFPFGQDTTSFELNINNIGNLEQHLRVDLTAKNENLLIFNKKDLFFKPSENIISLAPQRDTSISLSVKAKGFKRNIRRIDIDGHRPQTSNIDRKYHLNISTSQVSHFLQEPLAQRTKLTFIKLPNERKVKEQTYGGIPLTVQADLFGILTSSTFLNIFAYGQANIDENRYFVYRYQIPFSNSNKFNFWQGSPSLGYFFKKGNIQLGTVGGVGFGAGGGNGISGNYYLSSKHSIGAFYAHSPNFLNNITQKSYGFSYQYNAKSNFLTNLQTTYARRMDFNSKINSDNVSASMGLKLFKSHGLSLSAIAGNNHYYYDPANTRDRLGYGGNIGYGGTFFKTKLRLTLNTGFTSRYLIGSNSNLRSRSLIASYEFPNEWSSTFGYTFFQIQPTLFVNGNFITIEKNLTESYNLSVSNRRFLGGVTPSIFFMRTENSSFSTESKGMALNYFYNKPDDHFRMSFFVRGAYTRLPLLPHIPSFFTAQVNNTYNFRTLSFNARYFYGPFSSGEQSLFLNSSNAQPQTVRLSANYSYLFPYERFMINTSVNYRYSNYLEKSVVSVVPVFYYFTVTGWRFNLGFEYFFSSKIVDQSVLANSYVFRSTPTQLDENTPQKTQNLNINAGIKKDFVIPLFRKKHFDIDLISFLDVNGNGKKDGTETALQDVILRINEMEVITNDKGNAKLLNLPLGKYKVTAVSLRELQGWFPLTPDTIMITKDRTVFIPFVRGVRIYGSIVLDKEKYSASGEEPFDLSRIRITALDSSGKAYNTLTGFDGSFTLYVPIGKYTITMNEAVLTDRFKLVQNNIPLVLSKELENIFVSMYIIEKRRKLTIKKFKNNGDIIERIDNDTLTSPIKKAPVNNTPDTPSDNQELNDNAIPGNNNNSIEVGKNAPTDGKVNDNQSNENGQQAENTASGNDGVKDQPKEMEIDPKNPLYNPQAQDTPIPGSDKVKYYVQEGNKLEDIANAYGMTLEQIKTENKLKNNDLMPGQLLKVDKMKQPADVNYTLTSTTVLPGEDLYQLYKRVGMTVEEIVKVNNMKSDKIKPGQILRVKKY